MRERADACAWTKTIRKVRANTVSPPWESRRDGARGETYGNLVRNWITHNWPGEFKIYFRWCDSASLRGTAISPAARLTACSLRAQVDDGNPIFVIRVRHCLGRYAEWLGTCANCGQFKVIARKTTARSFSVIETFFDLRDQRRIKKKLANLYLKLHTQRRWNVMLLSTISID